VRPGHLSLSDLVRRMSTEAARVLKLPGGELTVGAPADITVFDPDVEWPVDPSTFRSKSHNTPFGGHHLFGRAVQTIVGGEVVYGG